MSRIQRSLRIEKDLDNLIDQLAKFKGLSYNQVTNDLLRKAIAEAIKELKQKQQEEKEQQESYLKQIQITKETMRRFFLDNPNYLNEVKKLLTITPQQPGETIYHSVSIEYMDLERYGNGELAEAFLKDPLGFVLDMTAVAYDLLQEVHSSGSFDRYDFVVRVSDKAKLLPTVGVVDARKVLTKPGNLVIVKGIVSRVSFKTVCTRAAYTCMNCGERFFVENEETNALFALPAPIPSVCNRCQRKGFLKFDKQSSNYRDVKTIMLTESVEEHESETPQSEPLLVYLTGDLVFDKRIAPGRTVRVIGITSVERIKRRGSVEDRVFIQAISVEVIDKLLEEIELSEEDKRWIQQEMKQPDFLDRLVKSIAPNLYDRPLDPQRGNLTLADVKEVICYQIVGPCPIDDPEFSIPFEELRPLHVHLLGDPGLGKTQLLIFVSKLLPRAQYVTLGSTKAGLGCITYQDKELGWVVELGALPLADRGICCIDEVEKIASGRKIRGKAPTDVLHEVMSIGRHTVHKSRFHIMLPARCAILAASNPRGGRYDPELAFIDNVTPAFKETVLARFDFHFVIRDIPTREIDKEVAKRCIMSSNLKPPYTIEQLQKIFSYIKKYVPKPRIPEDVAEYTSKRFAEIREQYRESGAIPLTYRQVKTIKIAAMCRARLLGRVEVTREDVERVFNILLGTLEQIAKTPEGAIDVIYAGAGLTPRQRELRGRLLQLIPEDQEILDTVVIEKLEQEGYTEEEIRNMIARLIKDQELWEPYQGFLRRYRAKR